jgi:hypothetical protein
LRLFEEPEEVIVRELRALDLETCAPDEALRRLRAWRELLDPPTGGGA